MRVPTTATPRRTTMKKVFTALAFPAIAVFAAAVAAVFIAVHAPAAEPGALVGVPKQVPAAAAQEKLTLNDNITDHIKRCKENFNVGSDELATCLTATSGVDVTADRMMAAQMAAINQAYRKQIVGIASQFH
jgi:hypothetical protein